MHEELSPFRARDSEVFGSIRREQLDVGALVVERQSAGESLEAANGVKKERGRHSHSLSRRLWGRERERETRVDFREGEEEEDIICAGKARASSVGNARLETKPRPGSRAMVESLTSVFSSVSARPLGDGRDRACPRTTGTRCAFCPLLTTTVYVFQRPIWKRPRVQTNSSAVRGFY